MDKADARRERNKRHHAKSKARQDHLLLRLDPGGAALLDEAARALGLSRAACARLLLPALLGCLGPRLAAIEAARGFGGQSLGRFLGAAIDDALMKAARDSAAPPSAAALEFDALFH